MNVFYALWKYVDYFQNEQEIILSILFSFPYIFIHNIDSIDKSKFFL